MNALSEQATKCLSGFPGPVVLRPSVSGKAFVLLVLIVIPVFIWAFSKFGKFDWGDTPLKLMLSYTIIVAIAVLIELAAIITGFYVLTGRAYIRLSATDLAVKFWWGAGRVEWANISDISCSNLSVITYFDGKPTRWWQLNRHFHGGKGAITLYGMDVWI
jgi:hypothetical protein